MEHLYRQDTIGSVSHEQYSRPDSHGDESMGGMDESISTPPTGSYSNNHPSADSQHSNGNFSPLTESDPNVRYNSPNMSHQQGQPVSRPSSGLSGSGDRYGYSQTYQDQNQRPSQSSSEPRSQNSVVIKVGMVGDAQIGKTSLMVKYVEGSWDEDYIQTLGMNYRPIAETLMD